MFDEFVEHAGGNAPVVSSVAGISGRAMIVPGMGGLAPVGYQGFEERDDDEGAVNGVTDMQALEGGYIPSGLQSEGATPMFSLSHVQFTLPAPLIALVASSNLLFMALYPLSLIIIDLTRPEELINLELPKPAATAGAPASSVVISNLFTDPTGRHLLVTTSTADTFYLPVGGGLTGQVKKFRPLRLKQSVTAVAWSPSSSSSSTAAQGSQTAPSTADVLIGSSTGQISTLTLPPSEDMLLFKTVGISNKPLERDLHQVYALSEQAEITGLGCGFWGKGSSKKAWVLVTTESRIYEVQGPVTTRSVAGKGGWAEEVFKPVRDGAPKFQELPGSPPSSELRFYYPSADSKKSGSQTASAAAWLTSPGLYHFPIPASASQEILSSPSLLPYSTGPNDQTGDTPLSIAITEWHFVLLFSDRVMAIDRQMEKVVWEEMLPLKHDEHPIGLSADPISKTFWVYTGRSIFELVITDETRDVWRAMLEKGAFVEALTYAKTPAQKDIVVSRQADSLFEQHRYIQAAQCYAKSSKSFEFVTLRFLDVDERDALRVYLADRLDNLDTGDLTQRMMLATWLVEIYLSKCNTLEDIVAAEAATSDVESLSVERTMMEDDLKNFMTTYRPNLDPSVVYELILSHGRTDLYLFYAELNRDHARVIQHWVAEDAWLNAIDALNRQDSLELYYRFASVLMRHAPKETVDALLKQPLLASRRLIPALLQQRTASSSSHAIRYLTHLVQTQETTDPTIHNLLITFLAADANPDDDPLLRYLTTSRDDPLTGRPYFDLDYALRLCKQHGRIQPCVHIYSKMGLYESSVDLALEKGDLELAKINADRPVEDEGLRKKLWLKIARFVVQEQKDIKGAMTFLESTDLVKIEDILPFFPDFVIIDDFKMEICAALEEYSAHIDALKGEMDDATASAESIKRDIAALSARFVTVEQDEKCAKCAAGLLIRQFYVFPCQHSFHADCLIGMAKEYLPSSALRRILHLQNDLVKPSDSQQRQLLSSGFSGTATPEPSTCSTAADLLLGLKGRNKLLAAGDRLRELIIPDALASAVGATTGSVKKSEAREGAAPMGKKEREELDRLIAAVCPLCEGVVSNLVKPFIAPGEDEGDWEL